MFYIVVFSGHLTILAKDFAGCAATLEKNNNNKEGADRCL
jgi:hypothetical protein